jgi:hypothetical protein
MRLRTWNLTFKQEFLFSMHMNAYYVGNACTQIFAQRRIFNWDTTKMFICVQIDQKLKWFRPDWINLKLTNFSLYSTEVSKKKKYSHSSNQMFGAIKLIKMYLKELAPQLS